MQRSRTQARARRAGEAGQSHLPMTGDGQASRTTPATIRDPYREVVLEFRGFPDRAELSRRSAPAPIASVPPRPAWAWPVATRPRRRFPGGPGAGWKPSGTGALPRAKIWMGWFRAQNRRPAADRESAVPRLPSLRNSPAIAHRAIAGAHRDPIPDFAGSFPGDLDPTTPSPIAAIWETPPRSTPTQKLLLPAGSACGRPAPPTPDPPSGASTPDRNSPTLIRAPRQIRQGITARLRAIRPTDQTARSTPPKPARVRLYARFAGPSRRPSRWPRPPSIAQAFG